MTSDIEIDDELKRAGRNFANGNFKKAKSRYRRILSQRPDEVRALVGLTRVDAELGKISFGEALETVRGLATSHPDNDRIPGSLVTMLDRMGRIEDSMEERRKFLEVFPSSSVALQMWANGIQVNPELRGNPETQATAWEYYKKALQSGPLLTPCFKSAAYHAAKRTDPKSSHDALRGSGFVERQALITRGLGPNTLSAIFAIGAVLATLTFPYTFSVSLTFQILTFSWGVWCVYTNNLMCCKRCRNSWILMVGLFSIICAAIDHPRTWYIVAGLATFALIWAALTKRLTLILPTSKNAVKEEALN